MDPINHTTSAGFAARDARTSIRVTDNVSSLQTETVTILGALAYASLKDGHMVIHTDSKSAIG